MKKFFRALPHINIILALMMLTFVIIDHYNNAMQFVENDITKGLLFVFSLLSIICSVLLAAFQRR